MNDRAMHSSPADVMLCGEQFQLSELTDADSIALDQWVQAQCVAAARASLSDDASQEEYDRVVGAAARAAVGLTWTAQPGRAAIFTFRGYARLMWTGLRRCHPLLKEPRVRDLLKSASRAEKLALSDAYFSLNHVQNEEPAAQDGRPFQTGREGQGVQGDNGAVAGV